VANRARKKSYSIPIRPLTNFDLIKYAKLLKIPHFRGVFMRDSLPRTPRKHESGILNLDTSLGPGTHWVCYCKDDNVVYYFDSFGNLRPPPELVDYLGPGVCIKYNYNREQGFNSVVCGHLCLKFLTTCLPSRGKPLP